MSKGESIWMVSNMITWQINFSFFWNVANEQVIPSLLLTNAEIYGLNISVLVLQGVFEEVISSKSHFKILFFKYIWLSLG